MARRLKQIKAPTSYMTMDARGVPIVRKEIIVPAPPIETKKPYLPKSMRAHLFWRAADLDFRQHSRCELVFQKHEIQATPKPWKLLSKEIIVSVILRQMDRNRPNVPFVVWWKVRGKRSGARLKTMRDAKAWVQHEIERNYPDMFKFQG
jgi:hypothetical protein